MLKSLISPYDRDYIPNTGFICGIVFILVGMDGIAYKNKKILNKRHKLIHLSASLTLFVSGSYMLWYFNEYYKQI